MTRITMIRFNPEDIKDTMDALKVAKTEKENDVVLEPCTNLISTECLYYITREGYTFNGRVFNA